MAMARGNVLIIDPNQLFREGLKQLLLKAGFAVGGVGKDLAEATKKAVPSRPADLVIVTLEPGSSMEASLDQIRLIRRSLPAVKLVALAASLSHAEFLQIVRVGVDAVLTNNISIGVLQALLDLVMQSQQILFASIGQLLADVTTEPGAGEPKAGKWNEGQNAGEVSNLVPFIPLRSVNGGAGVPFVAAPPVPASAALAERSSTPALSEREGQILGRLTRGLSNKAIARELDIAETTVKVHVKGLMRKVRVANRTQVAIWAMNHYFTPEGAAAQDACPATGLGIRMSSGIIVEAAEHPCSA